MGFGYLVRGIKMKDYSFVTEIETGLTKLRILKRANPSKTILLYESGTNVLFENSVSELKCSAMAFGGKHSTISLLQAAQRDGIEGILAIADADFDRINLVHSIPAVFLTDFHDSDVELFNSFQLENELAAYLDKKKIETFLIRFKQGLKRWIFSIAKYIGILQCYSEKENLQTSFQKLDFKNYVVEAVNGVTKDTLLTLFNPEGKKEVRKIDLQSEIIDTSDKYDTLQVCIGHHIFRILIALIKNFVGNETGKFIRKRQIRVQLRKLKNYNFFETMLYASLKKWESQNKGFLIF